MDQTRTWALLFWVTLTASLEEKRLVDGWYLWHIMQEFCRRTTATSVKWLDQFTPANSQQCYEGYCRALVTCDPLKLDWIVYHNLLFDC